MGNELTNILLASEEKATATLVFLQILWGLVWFGLGSPSLELRHSLPGLDKENKRKKKKTPTHVVCSTHEHLVCCTTMMEAINVGN